MTPFIRIHPADNVVIARRQLLGGTTLEGEGVTVAGLIPPGHKIATRPIATGEAVRRYNQIIGTATQAIAPGQHVHTHNLAFSDFQRAHEPGAGRASHGLCAAAGHLRRHRACRRSRGHAQLHRRADQQSTARPPQPAPLPTSSVATFTPRCSPPYPNVDGVVALTHGMGCATDSEGEELQVLRRTLGGYARHANFYAVLVVGPGLRDQPDPGAGGAGGAGRRRAHGHLQHPGHRRHDQDRGARGRADQVDAARRQPRAPRTGAVPGTPDRSVSSAVARDGFSSISANPASGCRHGFAGGATAARPFCSAKPPRSTACEAHADASRHHTRAVADRSCSHRIELVGGIHRIRNGP